MFDLSCDVMFIYLNVCLLWVFLHVWRNNNKKIHWQKNSPNLNHVWNQLKSVVKFLSFSRCHHGFVCSFHKTGHTLLTRLAWDLICFLQFLLSHLSRNCMSVVWRPWNHWVACYCHILVLNGSKFIYICSIFSFTQNYIQHDAMHAFPCIE